MGKLKHEDLPRLFLSYLDLTPTEIPLYEHCYLEDNYIVIKTNSGGANRKLFESKAEASKIDGRIDGPFNSDLYMHPLYEFGEDTNSSKHCYQAKFYFKLSPDVKEKIDQITDFTDDAEKFHIYYDAFAKNVVNSIKEIPNLIIH